MAFHKDMHLGAKEELSPTLLGVNSMAMKFLPADLRLLTVISVSRQIVAGVKYELLVNAMTLAGERIVCNLVVLERPWIVNEWGEKWRQLRASNCTKDDEPVASTPPETFHTNPVFVNKPVSLTEDQMRELEAQILRGNAKKVENVPRPSEAPVADPSPGPSPAVNQDPESTPSGLSPGVKEELDKFFSAQQLATQQALTPTLQEEPSSSIPSNSEIPSTVEAPKKQEEDENLQQVLVPVFEIPLPLPTEANQEPTPVVASRRRRRLVANSHAGDVSKRSDSQTGFVEIARYLGDDFLEEVKRVAFMWFH